MIGGARHLDERTLLDECVAVRAGEPPSASVASHLAACPQCTARYAELDAFMNEVRSDADAAVDEQFSQDDLMTARRQIARRIENLGQIARVIAFPGRRPSAASRRALPLRATRWVAGAAAAGLLVGMVLGAYTDRVGGLETDSAISVPAGIAADRMLVASTPEPELSATARLDEDAFLQEVELASVGLRTAALTPFDVFTPTVREVSAQLR